jgi:hypothetical protein
MFSLTSVVKASYVLGLSIALVLLLWPNHSRAQRAPIAPMLGIAQAQAIPSFQMAQQQILLGGMPMGMMMLGGAWWADRSAWAASA